MLNVHADHALRCARAPNNQRDRRRQRNTQLIEITARSVRIARWRNAHEHRAQIGTRPDVGRRLGEFGDG